MTLSLAAHQTFVALAGPTFSWEGSKGHRPPATWRTGLRNWLISAQGNVCPVCAGPIVNAQFNHIIGRGPNVKGFLPGNVFAGCASCNIGCANLFGEVKDGIVISGGVIPLSHFKAPEVIPTEWPGTATLKACK